MEKLETLQFSLNSRNDEIEAYQINIDNYIRAIEKINADYSDNPPIVEFRDNIIKLLEEHQVEQLKSIILRDVIADQLEELKTKTND